MLKQKCRAQTKTLVLKKKEEEDKQKFNSILHILNCIPKEIGKIAPKIKIRLGMGCQSVFPQPQHCLGLFGSIGFRSIIKKGFQSRKGGQTEVSKELTRSDT